MNPLFLAHKYFKTTKDYLLVPNMNSSILLSEQHSSTIRVGNIMHGEKFYMMRHDRHNQKRVAKVSKKLFAVKYVKQRYNKELSITK